MAISSVILSLLHEVAIFFPVLLFIVSFRNFFKAAVATLLGDRTAADEGFLTINPLVHADIIMLLLFLLAFATVGHVLGGTIPRRLIFMAVVMLGYHWRVSVPLDEDRLHNPRLGAIACALSGPFGSILLSFLALVAIKFLVLLPLSTPLIQTLGELLRTLVRMSLFFGVLNLVPLPPFDAGRILALALPPSWQGVYDFCEEYALYIFLILFFMPLTSDLFLTLIDHVQEFLHMSMFKLLF